MHLTLAFLGEVSKDEVKSIIKAMKASVTEPFIITLAELGKFSSRGEMLYWYGVKASEALTSLQRKLIQELKKEQLSPDEKAFKPHITLARRCKMKEGFTEIAFCDALTSMVMRVNKISLMESERINGKLIYSEITAVDF